MGIQPYDPDMSRSEDDIRRMVSDSEKGGEIDPVESRLIDNVFDFADRVAREVMVPRQDMICLFVEDSLEENLKVVTELSKALNDTCTQVPIYLKNNVRAYAKGLEGFKMSPSGGMYFGELSWSE